MNARIGTGLVFAAWLMAQGGAQADPIADFYHGKQITIVVGTEPGGPYDVIARTMGRYFTKYLPGAPVVIVQNMPGAGGVTALNNVANLAPKDGTVIAVPQSGSALEPAFHMLSPDGSNAKFDGAKLNWIGSIEDGAYLFAFWHASKIMTFDDLKREETLVGASSVGTDEYIFPALVNAIFGTKMKIISGYGSSPAVSLAMERGEVAGALNTYSSMLQKRPNWLKDKLVRVVLQLNLKPYPPLGDAPMALDLAKTEEDKQALSVVLAKGKMARPFVMAEGVPAERVTAIRTAFLAALDDPACRAEIEQTGQIISPVKGEDIQKTIETVYKTPEPLLRRVREAIGGKG